MSTIQSVIDRMRVRLEEDTARKWSDSTQLIPYASEAERWLARTLSHMPKSKRFRYRQSITWTASSETFDLTTLTKRFDWLINLGVLVGSVYQKVYQFEDDDEDALWNLSLGGGAMIPRVTIADDTLVREPSFGTAQTFRIRYGYIPAIKTSASDTLETPDEYLLDVVNRAMHFANADAGISNKAIDEEYAVRLGEIEDLERARLGIRNERVVRRDRTFARCR